MSKLAGQYPVDDVNALRSVCPTFAKKARKKHTGMADIAKLHPEFKLSKQRIEYLDIVSQIHTLLVNTVAHLKLGDGHLSV